MTIKDLYTWLINNSHTVEAQHVCDLINDRELWLKNKPPIFKLEYDYVDLWSCARWINSSDTIDWDDLCEYLRFAGV